MNLKHSIHTVALSVAILLTVGSSALAGPARRGIIRRQQPDGSTVSLRLIGDEHAHTLTSLDGRPMIKDDNGFYRLRTDDEVARLNANVARRSETTRGTSSMPDYRMSYFNARGDVRGVVLLVAFADVPFCMDSTAINALLTNRFNGENYTEDYHYDFFSKTGEQQISISGTIPGSARDYFRDQSFGQFTPTFDVYGPITLDKKRIDYGGNNRNGDDNNARGMVQEACKKAYDTGLVDFTPYDNDGDGMVDYVYVIYAGPDEAQTGIEECVWAHSWDLSSPLSVGSKKVSKYACSGEIYIDGENAVAGIGTFVHEFSHVIGLPDYYNTQISNPSYDDFCMDYWSIMDYGQYAENSYAPVGYTSFERYSMGWIPAVDLDSPDDIELQTTNDDPVMYRTFVNERDTTSYYVFESIQRTGWDYGKPGYGLMITNVNYSPSAWRTNTVNGNKNKHRYAIVPANNDYTYNDEPNQIFGKNNYEFSPTSTPASITCFGDTLFKPLTDITRTKNGPCTFKFMGGTPDGIIQEKEESESINEVYRLNDHVAIVKRKNETYKVLIR